MPRTRGPAPRLRGLRRWLSGCQGSGSGIGVAARGYGIWGPGGGSGIERGPVVQPHGFRVEELHPCRCVGPLAVAPSSGLETCSGLSQHLWDLAPPPDTHGEDRELGSKDPPCPCSSPGRGRRGTGSLRGKGDSECFVGCGVPLVAFPGAGRIRPPRAAPPSHSISLVAWAQLVGLNSPDSVPGHFM